MKGLGRILPFHRFTNPRRDKSVYFWSWGSYLFMSDIKYATFLMFPILGMSGTLFSIKCLYPIVKKKKKENKIKITSCCHSKKLAITLRQFRTFKKTMADKGLLSKTRPKHGINMENKHI